MNMIVLVVLCLFLVFLIRGLRARKRGEMVYNEVVANLKEKTRVALGLDDYEDFRPIPFFSDGGDHYMISRDKEGGKLVIASDDWIYVLPGKEERKCVKNVNYDGKGNLLACSITISSPSLEGPLEIHLSRKKHKAKGMFGKFILESADDFEKMFVGKKG